MKEFKVLAILFAMAACCFFAGAVNHAVHTGEGVIVPVLLGCACLCACRACMKKK